MTDTPKFDIVLNANDVDFVEQLRDAIGVMPGEKLEIVTPQFTRSDGKVINYFPRTTEEFDALKTMDDKSLKAIGCGIWDDGHWLYPQEWYWNIPNGYEVVCISGERKRFIPGKTDNDIRFGMLAYGFVKPTQEAKLPEET